MKLIMHVLKNNPKEKINNETISFREIKDKLTEEYIELTKAIVNYGYDKTSDNLKEVLRETFDLIQVCILVLFKSHKISKEFGEEKLIEDINIEHKDKLSDRGWNYETGIEIDVKE
ncbi:hypothetical protein [Clostridium sp. C2-6-12]|uniref:hypothetical protein n=1 Tax=Clostridium sp. C2-6-12 TaxID=2698832 RepID=UPI00136818FE|nr:hypothetical protein [Clostridium sp. C2-6-12]